MNEWSGHQEVTTYNFINLMKSAVFKTTIALFIEYIMNKTFKCYVTHDVSEGFDKF